MNNNQQPQTPQGGHLPDHRIQEIQDEIKALREQNSQLRGQIDYMARVTTTPKQQQTPKESPFDPKVDQALTEKFSNMLKEAQTPLVQRYEQQVGFLVDRIDELQYQQRYGSEKFAKYNEKVEKIRTEYQARGQYIPREEALRLVYFEEEGKKAAPQKPKEETTAPVFDPYMQTMVDPATGKPWVETEQQFQPPQPTQTPQQTYQPPQTPQQPQMMNPGFQKPQSNHPYQNPYGMPQLPDQGLNTPHVPERGPQGHLSLDLNASDDQLKAFEDRYGDMPL